MKFGVFIGPMYPGDMEGTKAFEFARTMARTAHESGFDGIFVVHRYATGPPHTLFHPLLLLAGLYSSFPTAISARGYTSSPTHIPSLRRRPRHSST